MSCDFFVQSEEIEDDEDEEEDEPEQGFAQLVDKGQSSINNHCTNGACVLLPDTVHVHRSTV